ncbi:MAG: hypothetical protein ACE5KM_15520 [Planctomycetaceae bacterium]
MTKFDNRKWKQVASCTLLDTVQEAARERKSDERHAKLTARLRSE